MSTITVKAYKCLRCGHVWLPREATKAVVPKVCPKCKSAYWDRPRKKGARTP